MDSAASVLSTALRENDLETTRNVLSENPDLLQQSLNWDPQERPLHLACDCSVSLEILQYLIAGNEHQAQTRDCDGKLPLHRLCEANPTVAKLACLLHCYPEAIQEMDYCDGNCPIHTACRSNCSVQVIQFLVDRWPQGLKLKTQKGWTALALACENHSEMPKAIQYLVDAWPDAAKIMSPMGDLPLHQICRGYGNQLIVQSVHQAFPQAIHTENTNGELPLRLSLHGPGSVIRYLIQEYPDAVCSIPENLHGDTNLHWLCRHNLASVKTLRYFVETRPTEISTPNLDGELPLHLACQTKETNIDNLRYLLEANPDAVGQLNFLGETSLEILFGDGKQLGDGTFEGLVGTGPSSHVIWDKLVVLLWQIYRLETEHTPSLRALVTRCGNTDHFQDCRSMRSAFSWLVYAAACISWCPASLLRFLCRMFPEVLTRRDENGLTPLLYSLSAESSDSDQGCLEIPGNCSTSILLGFNPDAAKIVDAQHGQLPLCRALRKHGSFKQIELLVEAYPDAIRQNDTSGTPVFILAAECSSDLDSVYILVRSWPEQLCGCADRL